MASVQLARPVYEAGLLIIRRPWVRVPPAPPAVISFIRCRSRTVSWTDVGGNVYSAATPSTPSGHAEQLPSGSWRAKAGICPPGRATSGTCRCPAGFFHAAALFPMCEPHPGADLGRRFDAARGRWPDFSADRDGIPRHRGDHGATDQPAKRRIAGLPLDQPGDLGTVLRVLHLVFNEGYSGNVDLAAERSASPVPHPAALQPVSRPSLNYFAFRDSFGSSGCMVSSCDLGGDDSGGRGGGDRCAWSGTGQPAALPDRAAVTATRPRSGGRASARRRLAGAAVPGLWRPGAGSRPARGGWSRPA